jgi:hypothetical protein
MMVVMTTWLPRRACSQPGMAAHSAPQAAAAAMAIGRTAQSGQSPSARQTSPVPSPPRIAWPSPPMLNRPQWKATATASPVKMKSVA